MTKTLRRRDLKKPVHDGKCWRGCDGSYCPICSGDRTNMKDKESYKMDDCKCIEPWIMETHNDYMCERCGRRYG